MLVDIFSSFDDHNFVFMSLYVLMWFATLTVLVMFNMSFWIGPTRWSYLLNVPKSIIMSQLMRSFGMKLGGFVNVVSSLFLMLIFFNLMGLIPYVFSITSHLAISFSLGFPLWLSLIISGAVYSPSSSAASLLPGGAPAALNPFLVLVETVSLCVRPITLSIRLVANMSAGHIVLGLIGTYLSSGVFVYSTLAVITLVSIQIFYFMFEIGVALIQAYIFSLLVTLYSDDHPSY
uniref:ATP synthase subunit a n=1 Tax=Omphalius rusticus TaxID=499952 RepID=A0A3B8DC86_9VEST|nr:ATP synthase F0 subunit 6 [Omphalius rusticus]AYJ22281.1 ATP synthase F0 subunit 6 [Omphalius rusticus]QPZ76000.1 ATP synthase F0 subunit 6 [Omphalius rusticus]UUJ34973.1 ATP synthase F0 subunit 6 [Omphalius rusticus]